MMNERMYGRFVEMKIDEMREVTEISDHCVVDTYLRMEMREEPQKGKEWHETEYLKFTEDRKERFISGVEEELSGLVEVNVEAMNNIMKSVADRTLKAKNRRRIGGSGKMEQPWMNKAVREEIKKRRKLNKEHRN